MRHTHMDIIHSCSFVRRTLDFNAFYERWLHLIIFFILEQISKSTTAVSTQNDCVDWRNLL